MGGKKTTIKEEQNRYPEQKTLDQLDIALRSAGQEGLMDVQSAGQALTGSLLRGQELPGAFGSQLFGLSEEQITDISQKSIQDLQPGFQKSGLIDSGINLELSARTAADTRRAAAEFNVGALQNVLNLAFGGSANVQSPTLGLGANLGQRLAGMGGGSATQSGGQNPFFSGIGQGFGRGFGEGFGTGLAENIT